MLTPDKIKEKLDELYPSRNSNILKEGRSESIALIETIMAQGFMDCLKFISEELSKTQNELKNKD